MLLIFSTPVLIRYLWQLNTFVFMHWYIISAVLLPLLAMASHYAMLPHLCLYLLMARTQKLNSPAAATSNYCFLACWLG